MCPAPVKALLFDVFGTVVDWRGSIIEEGGTWNREYGLDADWSVFADHWRGMYQPAMEQVRSGRRPWTVLDVLHRESLDTLITEFGLEGIDEQGRDHINRVWHRLKPWPDSVPGLTRLKQRFTIAPLSNGNVALLVDMARHAGLPWDAILGAEVAGYYKPRPEAYLTAARLLALRPGRCMMVAAHNDDLAAASQLGFRTAFVARPTEYGPGQTKDLTAGGDWDYAVSSLVELAEEIGA